MKRIRRRSALAALLALSIVAAACGGGDDGDSGENAGDVDRSATTAQQAGADERDAGEAVKGGVLRYGIEADSANGWAPYVTSCAISCRMIFKAIADPLFGVDDAGEAQPYLLASAEMNAAGTEHTGPCATVSRSTTAPPSTARRWPTTSPPAGSPT
ncbi:MAG: hypothetical protein R2755_31320 [Acidimicrobiales bacterium]